MTNNYELYHYGVKGMKWGVRRANRYESKARKYRSYAEKYDPKNRKNITSNERSELEIKSSKFREKAAKMEVKARLAKEGKSDLRKLHEASKLKGGYIDTQGLLRGPYADAVSRIRDKKGERYASELMRKHQSQSVLKFAGATIGGVTAYSIGMAYIINKL